MMYMNTDCKVIVSENPCDLNIAESIFLKDDLSYNKNEGEDELLLQIEHLQSYSAAAA